LTQIGAKIDGVSPQFCPAWWTKKLIGAFGKVWGTNSAK